MPKTEFSVVVLPAPLCPTMPTISPAPTFRLTSKTTCLAPYPACRPLTSRRRLLAAGGRSARPGGTTAVSSDCAKVRLREPGIAGQVGETALGGEPAKLHEADVVGQPPDHLQVVLDDADGPAG